MTNAMISRNASFDDWIERIELSELVGDVSEIADYLPYAKYVVGAYRWYRTKRAQTFLKSLAKAIGNLDEKARKKFEKTLRSDEGSELLGDYIDTVLRTSSRTGIATLALLYADARDDLYPKSLKLSAVIALGGISEDQIDTFLELIKVDQFIPDSNIPRTPYPVAIANDKLIAGLSEKVRNLLKPPEVRVAIISDLIKRGLLLPDYGTARLGDGGVGLTFGISSDNKKYQELLLKARSLLS